MSNVITTLSTLGPHLAKIWLADGTIAGYDNALQYRVAQRQVDGLNDLWPVMRDLASQSTHCIIRGQLIPGNDAAARGRPLLRRLDVFEDKGSRLFMVDVDNFQPLMYDPLSDPAGAVQEFVDTLPECFQQASYVWQLSGSMGHPSKKGLRAHVWFWLYEPMTCSQAEQWAKRWLPQADHTVHRTVQINYTADPIMGDGQVDPYAGRRLGYVKRECDAVVVPGDMPVPAHEDQAVARTERATKMADPRDKRGVIGALARAFEPAQIVDLFPDHFTAGSKPHRITWLHGGGSKEGVAVADNGTHLLNTHATSPIGQRAANLFDFVRAHVFGSLDEGIDEDALALDHTAAPSYQATAAWAREQPEVQEQLNPSSPQARAEAIEVIEHAKDAQATRNLEVAQAGPSRMEWLQSAITCCASMSRLENDVARQIAKIRTLRESEREMLAQSIQKRTRELNNGKGLPMKMVRAWILPASLDGRDSFPHVLRNGDPKLTRENLEVLLRNLGVTVRYDVIRKRVHVTGIELGLSSENYDNSVFAWLQSKAEEADMRNNSQALSAQLNLIADCNPYNPALEWIESAEWDGHSRVDELLETMKLRDEFPQDTAALMLRKWLLQAVAAAASPVPLSTRGVLTLQGDQYLGKTRWLRRLVGPHESLALLGCQIDPHSKDSVKIAISHWICELGEVGGTLRKADRDALKAFLSNPEDTIRLPYAASETKFQRRTVFAASVNEDSFLSDDTGNTRFWVIPVTGLDHDHNVDMQQLWAEMLQAWRDGEAHWIEPNQMRLINSSNQTFSVHDEVPEQLDDHFSELIARAKVGDTDVVWVWRTATQIASMVGIRQSDRKTLTRLGIAMSNLTGLKSKSNGSVNRRQVPMLKSALDEDEEYSDGVAQSTVRALAT